MKMSLCFNTTNGDDFHIFGGAYGDSTYVGTSGTYNAYSTYRSAMASGSVVPSNPSNPRLLTDAQFLGQ